MKKSSINELLSLAEKHGDGGEPEKGEGSNAEARARAEAEAGQDSRENEARTVSPAERIGRALLKKLGGTGLPEDKLADAIIAAWDDMPLPGADDGAKDAKTEEGEAEGAKDLGAEELIKELDGGAKKQPFPGRSARAPMPIKSSAAGGAPIDYESLTAKQFRQLKKQLQRAASEGKRVRL